MSHIEINSLFPFYLKTKTTSLDVVEYLHIDIKKNCAQNDILVTPQLLKDRDVGQVAWTQM